MRVRCFFWAGVLGAGLLLGMQHTQAAELTDDTQFDSYYLQLEEPLQAEQPGNEESFCDNGVFVAQPSGASDFQQRLGLYIADVSGEGQEYGAYVAQLICQDAAEYGVDPVLAASLFKQESGFRMGALSSAGAIGIAQLMPGTAAGMGYDPYQLEQNVRGGIEYLGYQLNRFSYAGDLQASLAVAAYNAGPDAVRRYGDVPPYAETCTHVTAIARNYAEIDQLNF